MQHEVIARSTGEAGRGRQQTQEHSHGSSEPTVNVRFDDQSAPVRILPETTFRQVKADGIRGLRLHADEQDAYRIVENGELIGDESLLVCEQESDLELLQLTLIKQPTLGI